eukprot:3781526-Amphidinium_carterae.1
MAICCIQFVLLHEYDGDDDDDDDNHCYDGDAVLTLMMNVVTLIVMILIDLCYGGAEHALMLN